MPPPWRMRGFHMPGPRAPPPVTRPRQSPREAEVTHPHKWGCASAGTLTVRCSKSGVTWLAASTWMGGGQAQTRRSRNATANPGRREGKGAEGQADGTLASEVDTARWAWVARAAGAEAGSRAT